MEGSENRCAPAEGRDVRAATRHDRWASPCRLKEEDIDPGKAPVVGRLVKVKRRFEDYLAQINNRTKELDSAADSIAQDTAVLLDAMDRSLKALARVEEVLPGLLGAMDTYDRRAAERLESLHDQVAARLDELVPGLVGSMDTYDRRAAERLEALHEQMAATLDELVPGLVGSMDTYDQRAAERLDALRERLEGAPAQAALMSLIETAPRGLTWKLSSQPTAPESLGRDDADLHLCGYVAGLVPDRHAIDVGAHRGEYTQALVDQGMTVMAVEPYPELAELLRKRFAGRQRVVVRESAAGASDGTASLFLARDTSGQNAFNDTTLYSTLTSRSNIAGLRFDAGPQVKVETVDQLRRSLDWPADIGLLKVDVEGNEPSVLQGLGETRPQALMFEYWGHNYLLVGSHQPATLGSIIDTLLDLGYRHWLTVIHDDGQVGFALNNREAPPRSWGNCLCFRSHETFIAAVRWCGTSMPEMIRTVGGP